MKPRSRGSMSHLGSARRGPGLLGDVGEVKGGVIPRGWSSRLG